MKLLSYSIFCFLLLFSSCSKKEDDDDSSSNNNPEHIYTLSIDSGWQFRATINGIDYSLADGNNATSYLINDAFSFQGSIMYNYGSILQGSSAFEMIRWGHQYPSGQVMQDQDFLNYFAPRTYTFSREQLNRIAIQFTDESGETWSTDRGAALQGGSEFQIIDVTQVQGIPDFMIRVYCRFRCFLYNDSGDSKILNNGEYVGLFRPEY